MGRGSNLLFRDEGFRGVVIKIDQPFKPPACSQCVLWADAGISLSALSNAALKESLTGLEFAGGIPGTLGGAVYMNAGAYGSEMKDVITEVELLTPEGHIQKIPASEMDFGYRTSRVQREKSIVLSAGIRLINGSYDDILAKMKDLGESRREKQPMDMPSAGSTFKRPLGYFAGKLIMDAGLSGAKVGGAQVSPKHCGFIVNGGGATARDVINLIEHVRETVYNKFDVLLEPEVRII
jgi:UDP-N-acetylmuramate dehydrogenase